MKNKIVEKNFIEHQKILKVTHKQLREKIYEASTLITKTFKNKGKIILCGNGGSAADSLHISSEFVGKFKKKRISLPSISLSSDVANLTCIANDFGYENVFSRQLEGIGKINDLIICFTTSGKSKNIIKCLKTAKKMSIKSILLSGNGGGKSKLYSDISLVVPSKITARIQEMHVLIGQTLCELVEKELKLV